MCEKKNRGHSLSEYGLLIGVLLVFGISSLVLLGNSVKTLFAGINQPTNANQISPYLTATLNPTPPINNASAVTQATSQATSPSLPGGNAITPTNGQNPATALVNGLSPVSVNVSSVEGGQYNALGDYRLAAYLDNLAANEPNPTNQAYYAQMAKLAYYLGANENQLDQNQMVFSTTTVSNADALNDILAKQNALKTLIDNPPPNLSTHDLNDALSVAGEVSGIAQSYQDKLNSFIEADGKVHSDFLIVNQSNNMTNGLGNTLSATSVAVPEGGQTKLTNQPYENVVPYDQLKSQVKTILAQNQPPISIPVDTTFKGAVNINQKAGN